jgi:hypothetical protein
MNTALSSNVGAEHRDRQRLLPARASVAAASTYAPGPTVTSSIMEH